MSTLSITTHGPLKDLFRFIAPITERRRRFRRASKSRPQETCIADLAAALHPISQNLVVSDIRKETPLTKTYSLQPVESEAPLAPFLAGQYISVELDTGQDYVVSRPYSLCTTPAESEKEKTYRITVRTNEEAFAADLIGRDWTVGSSIRTSAPQGFFTYEPLRDLPLLVCVAGGSGVTPFRSIIGDLLDNTTENLRIVLIQGARNAEELLFHEDFQRWEKSHQDRFRRICVLSEDRDAPPSESPEDDSSFRQGFIDADILADAIGKGDATLFICGPEAMHTHLAGEIASLKNKPRCIRREDYGQSGSPTKNNARNLTVRVPGRAEVSIPADPGETILVAMERAGLNPPSHCRTGSCGWCRGRLIKGQVDYIAEPTGLRRGDKDLKNFHPCIAIARTDIIVEIPAKPVS